MLDHQLYINWAIEKLEVAIEKLETSQHESGNVLMAAIIENLKDNLDLLTSNHQLF